jgi:hypothetical protein
MPIEQWSMLHGGRQAFFPKIGESEIALKHYLSAPNTNAPMDFTKQGSAQAL